MRNACKAARHPHSRLDLSAFPTKLGVSRAGSSRKPILFISFAHADEPERPGTDEIKWLSFVTGYLRPAVKHGAVEIWIDALMQGGTGLGRDRAQASPSA